MHTIKEIISHFSIPGKCITIRQNKKGHINSTYISEFSDGSKYTHQKINKKVFSKPEEVMKNIDAVTRHIIGGGGTSLEIIPSITGEVCYKDFNDDYWRTYRYIDDVVSLDIPTSTKIAEKLGEIVGTFQNELSDFPGKTLYETIPHFHDMALRYRQLDKAIKENKAKRLDKVKEELKFLQKNKERGTLLWNLMEKGELPIRVTHNDTKLNNVLFSKDEEKALCIIDLDTVMPGTILFDTGDMIRTATITGAEDEKDLSKISCNAQFYKALLKGYLSKASSFLTKKEKELICESGRNITQIMAVRMITDYLNGDEYYATSYEEQNLDRARTQIKLIQSIDEQWEDLNEN